MATYGVGQVPRSSAFVAEMQADAQGMVDEVVAAHPGLLTRVPVSVAAVVGAPAEGLAPRGRRPVQPPCRPPSYSHPLRRNMAYRPPPIPTMSTTLATTPHSCPKPG